MPKPPPAKRPPSLWSEAGDAVRGAAEGAVTGLLGGPVDLATMALRPLGYDVEKPVGGSEWIRDRMEGAGAYPERTGSTGEAVGELAGSLFAPGPDPAQYAMLGGLGMGAIKAYHGSGKQFPGFRWDKIGSGEGAQAFTYGHYFAGNPEVSNTYYKKLSKKTKAQNLIDGKPLTSKSYNGLRNGDPTLKDLSYEIRPTELNKNIPSILADRAKAAREEANRYLQRAAEYRKNPPIASTYNPDDYERFAEGHLRKARKLEEMAARVEYKEPDLSGAHYEVKLDVEPEQLLDLDKPLKDQSEHVKNAIRGFTKPEVLIEGKTLRELLPDYPPEVRAKIKSAIEKEPEINEGIFANLKERLLEAERAGDTAGADKMALALEAISGRKIERADASIFDHYPDIDAKEFYDWLTRNRQPSEVSRSLFDAGVPGAKFLDGFSRRAGEGNSNYVIYDDALTEITGRLDKPKAK